MDVTPNKQLQEQLAAERQETAMDGPLGKPVFRDRNEAEVKSINDLGDYVKLEAPYKGDEYFHVKRWTTRKWFDCIDPVAGIIATLFPNDLLFLVQVDYNNTATAAVQVADIFKRVYEEIMQVICLTCDVDKKEDVEHLINNITWLDTFEIFAKIIEQEINSATAEAILKKVQRLLIERFRLASGSFDFNAILALAMSMPSSTDTPSTNS